MKKSFCLFSNLWFTQFFLTHLPGKKYFPGDDLWTGDVNVEKKNRAWRYRSRMAYGSADRKQ